mgnify:FL=1
MKKNMRKKNYKKYKKILNKIEKIRGKNNKNWMDILRLSFNLDPQKTAKILSKIYEDDQRISRLAKKLTK